MTASTTATATTVLEELVDRLERAASHDRNEFVAPAVILWTDKDEQWKPLLPRLRERLPHLLTVGDYDPASRSGPAIWLRCMIARTLEGTTWGDAAVPILYLPGISRQQLRAVEDCPADLQPLAELQYRGTFWSQLNARDWTLVAFLQSKDGGLGLDVSRSSATANAIADALVQLADVSVEELRNRRLGAPDFHQLIAPDPVKQLLLWMNAPEAVASRWDKGERNAFRSMCRAEYGFDPEKDGPLAAAELLGGRQGKWANVWNRFAEAPTLYRAVSELLRQAEPEALDLTYEPSSWPRGNEEAEQKLRVALKALAGGDPSLVRDQILELEAEHGARRDWVWACLGQAPLAMSLHAMRELSRETSNALAGKDPDSLAWVYHEHGWQADAAVVRSLAHLEDHQDREAVAGAIRKMYEPWASAAAERLQQLVKALPGSAPLSPRPTTEVTKGRCVLFADALRMDVGRMLEAELTEHGYEVQLTWRWAAIPSVTPTAKPAVSPVAPALTGSTDASGFLPTVAESGKGLAIGEFRKLLDAAGYQVLGEGEVGEPDSIAWTEYGTIDRHGHDEGAGLARRVGETVRTLANRVTGLIHGGWTEVVIVTDHGWLLLPGGLPKTEVPHYLAETCWGRCAALKEGSETNLPVVPWHWNTAVRIALAPGISVFRAGQEYAHGGLSVQECVTPVLAVRTTRPTTDAKIGDIKWVGMRCRVQAQGHGHGWAVDIRTKLNDPSSTVTGGARPVDANGQCALLVSKEGIEEGEAVVIVLLTPDGTPAGKKTTTVGGGD